jgi:hypothetical protein
MKRSSGKPVISARARLIKEIRLSCMIAIPSCDLWTMSRYFSSLADRQHSPPPQCDEQQNHERERRQ